MKKITILLILSLLLLNKSFTQEYYQLEEMFLDADSWFYYEDYKEALPLFLRVLEADSLNYNVMYKIGYCYLQIPGQHQKSIPYLENAIKKTTFNYKDNSYNEKLAPVDALFYLGNAYLVNNRINEAIDAYTGFQNKITRTQKVANKDVYDTEYLQKQFDACRNAIQFQYEPVNFIAKNAGNKINTRFDEFNAVISGDGSTMVFTASLQFYDAIFYSKKDSNGQWSYPINLMGQLGIDDNSASTGISYDGTELYIYRDDDFDGNIYVSYLKNGFWTKARKLGENINTKYWESHASVSPDNKKLYFVSNRPDSYGDLDIYVSERLTDTTWGKAVNLGITINTRWNENTPFLTTDGKKLFFSSEGHTGMGGYDLFYSELDKNGNWTKPVNIGYPINTTDNDLFFVPYKDGRSGYRSQVTQQGYGGQDIYYYQLFNIPKYDNLLVEGLLEMDNKNDRNNKEFTISIIDASGKDTLVVLKPDDKSDYQYQTPLGANHLVYESTLNDKNEPFIISANYNIKETFKSRVEELKPLAAVDTVPEIKLDTNQLQTSRENIKIKLSLHKGNKLVVNTFYNDKLINSEEFEIKKEDFIYEYKPLPGESKIRFKLIDKNNNIKTEEVTVSYLPKDTEAELNIADQIINLGANGDKTVKIKLSVEKGSKLIVETFVDNQLINTENFDIKKESFVYEFEPKGEKSKLNFKLVDKHNNVKNEEVIISHKPVNKDFAQVLNEITTFNNNGFKNLVNSKEIKTAISKETLINQIYSIALASGISKEQVQALIIALVLNTADTPDNFVSDLAKLAKGDLKLILDSAITNKIVFNNNLEVIQYLEKNADNNTYNHRDIVNLLENYLKQSNVPVKLLLAKIDKILYTDISTVLTNLNVSAIDITTLEDFKAFLDKSGKYTKEELNMLYALMEGMLVSSNATKNVETPAKSTLASKDKKDTKIWKLVIGALSGVILALILIFFNRRRNKENQKK